MSDIQVLLFIFVGLSGVVLSIPLIVDFLEERAFQKEKALKDRFITFQRDIAQYRHNDLYDNILRHNALRDQLIAVSKEVIRLKQGK